MAYTLNYGPKSVAIISGFVQLLSSCEPVTYGCYVNNPKV